MKALAQCLSHSPAMSRRPLDTSRAQSVASAIQNAREALARFAPEQVIVFGPDHYNGFFYNLMPPFCVGAAAKGIGDYGTFAGPLAVDRDNAMQLHRYLLEHDFDIAISHDMDIDHGFTQPLEQLFGTRERSFIPVFINCIATPVSSCRRVIQLGEAIGRFCLSTGQRTAFIASGGLSHDAPLPSMDSVEASARAAIIEHRLLPPQERALRETRTLAAADQFAKGEGPLAPLNEDWDRRFMDDLAQDRWSVLGAMQDRDITDQGGRSGHEIRTWLAAMAALRVFGAYRVEQLEYVCSPEWIVGYGALRATA